MNRQIYHILYHYLNALDIRADKQRLKRLLYSHPEQNSLYAIVDTLDELNIEHVVLETETDDLKMNGFPALVHTGENGGTFLVVESMDDANVYYYKAGYGKGNETIASFESKWSKIALYAAVDEETNGRIQKNKLPSRDTRKTRTSSIILFGIIVALTFSFSTVWSFKLFWFLLFNLLGFTISIFLTLHEFGESNQILHKVCHLNRHTNCNKVLRSPAAKLFGWLSMSDIGLCYFSGSILSVLIAGVAVQIDMVLSWLFMLSICAFPYTIFSLSYQAFKIKKWCLLCLGIITVLWSQIIVAVIFFSKESLFPMSFTSVFPIILGFSFPIFTWAYFKPLWKEYVRVRDYENLYLRLKNTPQTIRALLEKEITHDMEFSTDEIHLGKVGGIHFTSVMSIYCNPCAREWKTLCQWLSLYPESLWLTIRFVGYGRQGDEGSEITRSLIDIYVQYGQEKFCESLTDWFKNKNYQEWKTKNLPPPTTLSDTLSRKYAHWEEKIPITYTPTLFVGNKILPTVYRVKDLKYLLNEVSSN
jgi:uncharacterized membrane protein